MSPFAPSDLSGLQLWLDADLISGSDGDLLTAWTDQAGIRTVSNAGGSARPTLKTNILNGRKVVRFASGNSFDVTPNTSMGSDNTFFFVFRNQASPVGLLDSAPSAANTTRNWSNNQWETHNDSAFDILVQSSLPQLLTITTTATPTRITKSRLSKRQSASLTVGTTTAIAWGSTWRIGNINGGSAGNFVGDLAAVIAYNRVLTATEIGQVEDYLQGRYFDVSTYAGIEVADAPQTTWKLDDASGTTAADATGDSRTGTYSGSFSLQSAVLVPNATAVVHLTGGKVSRTDGDWATPYASGGKLSLELSIKPDAISGSQVLMHQSRGATDNWRATINSDGTMTVVFLDGAGGTVATVTTSAVWDTSAQLLQIAYDFPNTRLEVLRNGTSVGSSSSFSGGGVDHANANPFELGTSFQGLVGHLHVWNGIALSNTDFATRATLWTGAIATTPSAITGTGTVQSPAPTDTSLPSAVAGTGSVQAPTKVDTPTPSTVAGTGTVQTPVPVDKALPSAVAGAGSVQAPSVATGSSATVALTTVAGTGTVQAPATVDASTPTAVTGTGAVQAPLARLDASSALTGTGTVYTPTIVTGAPPSPPGDTTSAQGVVAGLPI